MDRSLVARSRGPVLFSMLALATVACLCTSVLPFGGGSGGDGGGPSIWGGGGDSPPCVLTEEEVQTAIGIEVIGKEETREDRCTYFFADDMESILLVDMADEGDAAAVQADYERWREDNLDGPGIEDLSGVGDAAFWNGATGILSAYSGTVDWGLHFVGPGAADQRDAMVQLATMTSQRLP